MSTLQLIYAFLAVVTLVTCIMSDKHNLPKYTGGDWFVIGLCTVLWPVTLAILAMEWLDQHEQFKD